MQMTLLFSMSGEYRVGSRNEEILSFKELFHKCRMYEFEMKR